MNYLTFPIEGRDENDKLYTVKFKLNMKLLIDIYASEIEFNKKICPTLPDDAPRHKEFREITKLSNELKDCVAKNLDKEFNHAEYIDVFCTPILLDRKFETVYCSICNAEYKNNEVMVENWSFGEELFASGGRQIMCPKNHMLFSMMEWNS